MRSFLALAILAALAAVDRPARACGQSPPAYWTLLQVRPGTGESIPTDGAVLLVGKSWAEAYPDRNAAELAEAATIEVRDAAGNPVQGKVEPWYPGEKPTLLWRAVSPLASNADFTVKAVVGANPERPANVEGQAFLVIESAFRTTDGIAPPLQLTGAMQVVLDPYDLPLWKDCNDCGTGCQPNGSMRALRARVTIPPVQGGFGIDGYGAWFWLSNDRPHALPDGAGGTVVNLGGFKRLEAAGPTELVIPVPAEQEPYAPCFSLRVFDPAGHFVDAAPLCLSKMDPTETLRALDGKQNVSKASGGCSVMPRRAGNAGATAVLLAMLIVLRRLNAGKSQSSASPPDGGPWP